MDKSGISVDENGITQGDWRVVKLNQPVGYAEYQIAWSEIGELVADVVYTEADAKVMAAAPDLLEALQHVVLYCDSSNPALGQAFSAIKKAIGE